MEILKELRDSGFSDLVLFANAQQVSHGRVLQWFMVLLTPSQDFLKQKQR